MDKGRFGRQDRLIKDERRDAYREKRKLRDGTVCGECSAVYQGGRWTWQSGIEGLAATTCPACMRKSDDYPAGTVMIRGSFFREHKKEMMNLVRNVEKLEKGEHPLERIMGVRSKQNEAVITTTGVHIARRIGNALKSSYQGHLVLNYEDGEKKVQVLWQRE
jgi:NMD protein affecting ribosome stability and mRNA decay